MLLPKIKKNSSLFVRVLFIFFLYLPFNAIAQSVAINGEFYNHSVMPFKAPMRLTQAILYGKPKASSYREGFSLERQSEKARQADCKRFLLNSLQQLNPVTPDATTLYRSLETMPITGRMRIKTTLDGLFLVSHADPLLASGDVLYLPKLPLTIKVFGWAGNKKLEFNSGYLLEDYLKALAYSKAADKNDVYVISPQGCVRKVNVAYWNRVNDRIAPGAIIYVPIVNAFVKKIAPNFNLKMAQFLSAQRVH